jgi:hypothetical protein
MKVVYNELSVELKKQIGWGVPLKRDEIVQFQWLNIPEVKQNGEMLPVYGLKTLPNVDSIFDPKKNELVQIAYVVNELKNTEDNPTGGLGNIEFTKADKCTITISGRDTKKMDLLYYLRAHSMNQSNPLATPPTYGFVFKELEPVKTAKQKLKERQEVTSCESYIYDMKEAEVISLLKALKQRIYTSQEENMSALVEFVQVKANRDRFNSLSKDVRTPIAALIETALEKELIRYNEDPKTWEYVATKKPITQVPPQVDGKEHLLEYFHNNTHGKAFKEFLEKELGAMNSNESKVEAEKELVKVEKKNK